jgi:hypothetical protein
MPACWKEVARLKFEIIVEDAPDRVYLLLLGRKGLGGKHHTAEEDRGVEHADLAPLTLESVRGTVGLTHR